MRSVGLPSRGLDSQRCEFQQLPLVRLGAESALGSQRGGDEEDLAVRRGNFPTKYQWARRGEFVSQPGIRLGAVGTSKSFPRNRTPEWSSVISTRQGGRQVDPRILRGTPRAVDNP